MIQCLFLQKQLDEWIFFIFFCGFSATFFVFFVFLHSVRGLNVRVL